MCDTCTLYSCNKIFIHQLLIFVSVEEEGDVEMGEGAGVDEEEEVDKGEGGIKMENIATGKLKLVYIMFFLEFKFLIP